MCRLKSTGALLLCLPALSAGAIDIVVDYTYDTNNFFSSQQSRDAMQAVADRFSAVITSDLDAVGPGGTGTGTSAGWRVGFTHPGTGASFQLSTATSAGADPLGGGADVYGFSGLNANEWILYAGGRGISSAGQGGTSTGLNYTSTFNDLNGPLHRGVISNTPSDTVGDLPAWGGAITFDNTRAWDFSLDGSGSGTDFYTIALHEVGHALGLSAGWNQWQATGASYTGAEALAAYNADNGTSLTSLDLVSAGNQHWEDGAYDSVIFAAGNPNYNGTVGAGNLQDLLMEPIANFSGSVGRIELTNVDVAALRDIGWQTLTLATETPDLNGDGYVDIEDMDILLANWGDVAAGPAGGDANDDGIVNSIDLQIVTDAWGGGPAAGLQVPEPGTLALLMVGGLALGRRRRAA